MSKKLVIITMVLGAILNFSFANEEINDANTEQIQEMQMQDETVEVSEQEATEMQMGESQQEIEIVESEQEIEEKEK